MKILAQIFAIMSNLELEMNKARTRRGLNRAIEKGKWIGRPPKGFTTNENGYLVVKDDEYKLVSTAIDMILEDGESQYKVSRSTGINQSTLQNILDDEEKLSLYRQDKENAVKSLNNSRKD